MDFSEWLKHIATKWQMIWEKEGTFEADPDERPKYFCTFPIPYINGSVHVGHSYSALKVDLIARYKRMRGFNVMFPQGFHATGEPIVGAAKRLSSGDPIQRKTLKEYGIADKDIPKFKDPLHMAKVFKEMMLTDMKSVGLSIDWRRQYVTTTLTPVFSKFIEWQYLTLRDKGYVSQGSHPVIWCPSCKSPTGDHDRLEGEGVSVGEFTLLKFAFEDAFMLPATLRPETVYGVTNMYLVPDPLYKIVQVGDEKWIVSSATVEKLADQDYNPEVIGEFDPHSAFGKTCQNPVTGEDVLILPAKFIDPTTGTGVVMSVPAHAPVDWVALSALQTEPDQLAEFGVTADQIRSLKPIALIKVDGYGDFPAVEIIEEMEITDQTDAQIETATKTIYKKEFHGGVLREITGKWAGRKVSEVKDDMIEDFTAANAATGLLAPASRVMCRCGTQCHVKLLENQWFLNYGDEAWKEQTRQRLASMALYPPEVRSQFEYTIGWLKAKACARKSGLGTPLPWDLDWIVETLSDSTIYMSYYTMSKFVNAGQLKEEHAIVEFFDFVFLNKGDVDEVAKKSKLDKKLLLEIQSEFEYWYPMDLRSSGKDLIMNHLTFSIFQHEAIFRECHQPVAFGVNGFMSYQGQRMSKSRGVLTPSSTAVNTYGADLVRGGLLSAGEALNDASFSDQEVMSQSKWLETLAGMVRRITGGEKADSDMLLIDEWLESRMQGHCRTVAAAIENLMTRTAVVTALFGTMKDLRWYLRRRSNKLGPSFVSVIESVLKLLNPIYPHFCEELWEELGHGSEHLAFADYPQADARKENADAEFAENFIHEVMEDVSSITKVMKGTPSSIELIVAAGWKYEAYDILRSDPKSAMKKIMQNEEMRKLGKLVSKFVQKFVKEPYLAESKGKDREYAALIEAKEFLSEHYGVTVTVAHEEEATSDRASFAVPRRVAINIST